jgi:hypothetical protein
MNLDKILDEWDIDSNINEGDIGSAAIETSKLHAKYVRYLSNCKLRQVKMETELAQLRQIKFRYYRGELSREELSDLGWEQWRYAKPLKNEMDEFLKGDKDLTDRSLRLDYNKAMIGALESIIKEINNRHYSIKNWIEYRKFIQA